jgi:hypothetical protein
VRRFGDHYQDLIAWSAALRVIQPGSTFVQMEIEITGVGNVDDVILRSASGRHRYSQVKWAVHAADLVDHDFLTKVPKNSKSLLQKFFASWKLLRRADHPPVMELVTNRALDRSDPLLALCDGRSDLLTPAARDAPATSMAGLRITEWANHVGSSRDELLDMLDSLVFKTALTVSSEQDRAQTLMLANGLRADSDALNRGVGTVARWVLDGRRVLTADAIDADLDRLGLRADDPRAILLVQAIARDPHPDEATIALDWVDLYDGDSAPTRRQPRAPAGWATMSRDIDRAVTQLTTAGLRNIVLRGAMRQATFFTIGARLAQVTGTTLTYVQHHTPWPSNAQRVPIAAPETRSIPVGLGDDLAVTIGVAVDPTDAVSQWITATALPVRNLLTLLPIDGAHDQSVAGPGEAIAYAQVLRNAVRAELERASANRVHLFLAGPGGLALLLGHRWNRVAPTAVYEDLGPGRGYVQAFIVDA